MNYTEASKMKLRNGEKRLCKNVYLHPQGNNFCVRYYDTDVITLCPDNTVVINHGGFITKSTGEVICTWCPLPVDIAHHPSRHLFVLIVEDKTYTWSANFPRLRLFPSGIVQKRGGTKWVRMKADTAK